MDVLLKHGIHIDNFKIEEQEHVKLFLLTHGHKDHTKGDLKRFQPLIYCSYLTSLMIKHPNTFYLVPDKWYTVNNIEFYVFETIHCPGSYGYFFKELSILHLGDSRITPTLLTLFKKLNPKIILYDNTHCHFRGFFPPVESSAMLLKQIVTEMVEEKKRFIKLCLAHIGPVLLLQLLHLKVKPDRETLKPQVIIMLEALKLIDEKSHVIAVGMKSTEIDVIPSSQYFVINKLNPNEIVHDLENDRDRMRIFASFHAGAMEISMLSDYKLVSLNYDET